MKTGKALSFFGTFGLFWLAITISVLSSCKTDASPDPFAAAKFDPYDQELGKRIEAYQNTINPTNQQSQIPSLYIDFSSGINKAFVNADIQKMMSDCFNTILAQKFEVYKLGAKQITKLNISNPTELGQQVSDKNQYSDIWAPIQLAVEKIVEGNNDALLITDFEEWQGNTEITNTAFLKIPFKKWLEKGNSVHFFVANYQENKVNKHIYFTIFSYGKPNSSSLISKLGPKLSTLPIRFDLSDHAYELRTAYTEPKYGGIFYDSSGKSEQEKNVLDLKSRYINGIETGNAFEFYPLGLDWENIDKLRVGYQNKQQFNDLFRNLFINLSNNDSYHFGDLDVKVSDVSSDFESFAKTEEVKKHKPKLTKGTNGETKIADQESDAIASSCYTNNGKLKEEWIYRPQPTPAITEIFLLNKTLFKNTEVPDKKNIHLGIAFDPKFDVKNISNPMGLMKIDIVIRNAAPNISGEKLSVFEWKNAKGKANTALLESIRTTLQELQINNKIIHSYYIKTNQN